MQLLNLEENKSGNSTNAVRSFLIWTFTLIVSLLVIGFPLIVLMALLGAFLAMTLHTVLPMSSVLLVGGVLIGLPLIGVFTGAGFLTIKGIHPREVRWLHGKVEPNHNSVYANCPLTCNVIQ